MADQCAKREGDEFAAALNRRGEAREGAAIFIAALRRLQARSDTDSSKKSRHEEAFTPATWCLKEQARHDSPAFAARTGFLNGLLQVSAMNVNAWSAPVELYRGSVLEALGQDWQRVEGDLWSSVENLREELDQLPDELRDRVVDALAQYLRSGSKVET